MASQSSIAQHIFHYLVIFAKTALSKQTDFSTDEASLVSQEILHLFTTICQCATGFWNVHSYPHIKFHLYTLDKPQCSTLSLGKDIFVWPPLSAWLLMMQCLLRRPSPSLDTGFSFHFLLMLMTAKLASFREEKKLTSCGFLTFPSPQGTLCYAVYGWP